MSVTRCDIFCKVIDNYGDIGVCWRLARQLAAEQGLAVRLWVDDLASFARLAPALDASAAQQRLADLDICRWDGAAASATPADIVIEAFACDPPAAYVEAMAKRPRKPAWINLEYLSAEGWVEGSHGLPSPHPRLPLVKHFFFPGFTPATGGLIREKGLIDRLRAFQADAASQAAFWQRIAGQAPAAGALSISLFAYENAALPGLLDAWASGERNIFCAVTSGRHLPQVDAWLASRGAAGCGKLQLAFLPFLDQGDYDHLLAACALNFVRGEDSFVRAQWAGRPFVWHIYRQEEDWHRVKLDAFLHRYGASSGTAGMRALKDFWQAWERESDAGGQWPALLAALPELAAHAASWQQKLAEDTDLASKLLIFCQNLLECAAFPKAATGASGN
ncbi:elongation factor P maturation arginine rhamnosyltransferase EarP [Uliginosibacterium paludis]|uniref:Protein-arginine rhamnosyltransferase n=1 Tax=Uliginosibacterium paludis TaxID=1615952 RepID=A0ABV2CSS9_9RHOO